MEVPVWGTASPNETVTVEFLGKKVSATADDKGEWSLKLPAMKEAEPRR
jgi:sialate O-acetylesterase